MTEPTTRATPRRGLDHNLSMIVFLCTGNAARSVMAAAMLRHLLGDAAGYDVHSAGTLVLPGHPMSTRTRRALERHDIHDPWHRSHQLDVDDVARADLICAMEPSHVAWMRRTHPEGLPVTGLLKRIVRDLEPVVGTPLPFVERVGALALDGHEPEPWEELVDPASGEQADFDRCADELMMLVTDLRERLG